MNVYEESGFLFDFRAANNSVIHDKMTDSHGVPQDGNTIWPALDFRIKEDRREVWVEVKSWSFKKIIDRVERSQAKRDYRNKLLTKGADAFRDDIVAKFLGTTCYLSWADGLHVPQHVFYVVFLEPPDRGSAALLGPFRDRLRDEFKNAQARPWGYRIQYEVVELTRFRYLFPNYPVTRV